MWLKGVAGGVAQGQSICLVCTRSWVQIPAPQRGREGGRCDGIIIRTQKAEVVPPPPQWEAEAHLVVKPGFREVALPLGHTAADIQLCFYYVLYWFLLPVFTLLFDFIFGFVFFYCFCG